jgi:copper chaperone CopZ
MDHMKQITVHTNLHCARCVSKLGAVLDGHPGIRHWKADVNAAGKPVTVHGILNQDEITGLVEKAGFKVIPQAGFWKDRSAWKRASFNTLNCLLGCTIGDFAMVIFLQAFYPGTSMWLQALLATLAGLITSVALETMLLHRNEKFAWKAALRTALSMSFISMVAMELAMNATDFMITGGKAQLGSSGYWLAFIPAAVAGFLVPLPYNYFNLKKHNRACH